MNFDNIEHNGSFDIAIGKSRKEIHWKNREMTWSAFLHRISETHRTAEKYVEYMTAKKTRQDEIKDVGGFVGGYLVEGHRGNGSVLHRQLITLDIDFAHNEFWDDFFMLFNKASALYSTHKHSKETPRFRLVMPLDRSVTTDEYTAIARRIAGNLDINTFDDTTFEPTRLMYWPSTAKDAEFVFEYQDGPWIKADDILATYKNWMDASEWPVSDRAGDIIHRKMKKAGDPLEKTGLVGTFCREYDIHQVIENFLSDIYEPCDVDDRYTFKGGSTSAGLVIYNKGTWAYSHHGTDPVSGQLCNAFDLVRLHLFGLKDEDAKAGTAINHLPSYVAMTDFARQDPNIVKRIGVERIESIKDDFSETDEEDDQKWLKGMESDKKGVYQSTINNVILVLQNDPKVKGKLALNKFEQREVSKGNLPWRKISGPYECLTDKDDAGLRHYLEHKYKITGVQRIQDAINLIFLQNAFHPVCDYLKGLQWDGEKRLDTLFIDYLGAEDNAYTRAVTRKCLVAAVSRVFYPGTKFDYVLVLVGKQGVGKSSIVKKLGQQWYSDSFGSIQGKEAFEQIQGVWILEMAELAGLKKAEFEQIKHFISKSEDRYRVAYGKRTENFPRQCIFIGTTNNKDFLRDPTGNRRFWPVDTLVHLPKKDTWKDFTSEEVDQVWAEAYTLFKSRESLFLTKEQEEMALDMQVAHSETDDRSGLIQRYLEVPLPAGWVSMDTNQRRLYLFGEDELKANATEIRTRVSVAEIWCELFNKPIADMSRYNTKDLHNIMKNIPGWEEGKAPVKIRPYGMQRVYRRIYNKADIVCKEQNTVCMDDDEAQKSTPF